MYNGGIKGRVSEYKYRLIFFFARGFFAKFGLSLFSDESAKRMNEETKEPSLQIPEAPFLFCTSVGKTLKNAWYF